MSERIDHVAEARQHIEWAHEQQSEEGKFEFTVRDNALIAQAEATLAQVEQQRIANLIALAQPVELPGGEEVSYRLYESEYSDGGDITRYELRPEICEALGLRE